MKAKKPKVVKCRYAHCNHETKELNAEDAVCENKMYYHQDCYQMRKNINEIIQVFVEKVNPDVVMSALRRVVNDIVFNRGISSEQLLFGINYYIKNNIPLNYPGGLYYVIQDRGAKQEYEKLQDMKFIKEEKKNFRIEENTAQTFHYKAPEQHGFDAILR